VEFQRHVVAGSNMHYFDLLVRLRTEQEHLFRNIQRSEYHTLSEFIKSKNLKVIASSEEPGQGGTGVRDVLDDDTVDPHLQRIRGSLADDESDEEDEDFVAGGEDDGGSPTDDSGEDDGSDASGDGDGEQERTKKRKEPLPYKGPSKKPSRDGGDDGSKKKKVPRKKDPNAPKKARTAFIAFSNAERENIKRKNPAITFTEMGKVLGEKWRNLSAEEKEPFEAEARADKKRYNDESGAYKSQQSAANMAGSEDDSE